MTRRLWPAWRRPGVVVRDAMRDAGEHVAGVVTATVATSSRAVVAGALLGVVIGAALVWLGVSIGRQVT